MSRILRNICIKLNLFLFDDDSSILSLSSQIMNLELYESNGETCSRVFHHEKSKVFIVGHVVSKVAPGSFDSVFNHIGDIFTNSQNPCENILLQKYKFKEIGTKNGVK